MSPQVGLASAIHPNNKSALHWLITQPAANVAYSAIHSHIQSASNWLTNSASKLACNSTSHWAINPPCRTSSSHMRLRKWAVCTCHTTKASLRMAIMIGLRCEWSTWPKHCPGKSPSRWSTAPSGKLQQEARLTSLLLKSGGLKWAVLK